MSGFTYETGYSVPGFDELPDCEARMSCPEEDGMILVDVIAKYFTKAEIRLRKEAGRVTLRRLDLHDMASSIDFNVVVRNHRNDRGGDKGYSEEHDGYVLFDRPVSSFTLEQNTRGMWVPPLDITYANPLVLEEFIRLIADHSDSSSLPEAGSK